MSDASRNPHPLVQLGLVYGFSDAIVEAAFRSVVEQHGQGDPSNIDKEQHQNLFLDVLLNMDGGDDGNDEFPSDHEGDPEAVDIETGDERGDECVDDEEDALKDESGGSEGGSGAAESSSSDNDDCVLVGQVQNAPRQIPSKRPLEAKTLVKGKEGKRTAAPGKQQETLIVACGQTPGNSLQLPATEAALGADQE
eukprot:gene3427-13471_t